MFGIYINKDIIRAISLIMCMLSSLCVCRICLYPTLSQSLVTNSIQSYK